MSENNMTELYSMFPVRKMFENVYVVGKIYIPFCALLLSDLLLLNLAMASYTGPSLLVADGKWLVSPPLPLPMLAACLAGKLAL